MKSDAIIGISAAAAIILLGWKVSQGLSSAIENIGEGVGSTFSGAGSALSYTGQGIYEIGRGTGAGLESVGSGIEYIGQGVGSGVAYVGAGVYEVGKGAGYAVSGANPQDLVQTILPWGNEASTYGTSSATSTDKSLRTTSSSTDSGLIPTATKTLGLIQFSPISAITSWVAEQSKSVRTTSSSTTSTGSAVSLPVSTGNTGVYNPFKTSSSSSSSSSSSKSLRSSTGTSTAKKNILLETINIPTKNGVYFPF